MAPALPVYKVEGAGWTPNLRWSKCSIRQEDGSLVFESVAPGKAKITGKTLDEIDFQAVVEDWNDGCRSVCEILRGDPRPHLPEYLDSLRGEGLVAVNQAGALANYYHWMLQMIGRERRWPNEGEMDYKARNLGLAGTPPLPWK